MEGDWSDAGVTGNTDRTQQTIELINKIEMLEKKLKIAMHCINEYCRSGYNPLAWKTKRQIEELDNGN